jgi:TusA-related sulfurtransferase
MKNGPEPISGFPFSVSGFLFFIFLFRTAPDFPCKETNSQMMTTLDLRGVRCPLSWAKAKVHLESLMPGDGVILVLDDPKAVRDIPQAAEAEGYIVAEPEFEETTWRLAIHV